MPWARRGTSIKIRWMHRAIRTKLVRPDRASTRQEAYLAQVTKQLIGAQSLADASKGQDSLERLHRPKPEAARFAPDAVQAPPIARSLARSQCLSLLL